MLLRFSLLFLILTLVLHCSAPPPTLKVVELHGTPYECGFAYGRHLEADIRETLQQWQQALAQQYGASFDSLKNQFLRNTDYKTAIQKWTPGLLDQVRGMADGANLDFDTLYFLQISEEFENYFGSVPHKCTALGVHKTPNQPTLLAQNMDPPHFLHGHPTLLHMTDSTGLQTFIFTAPGLLGLNGMNSKSIGVTCNALPSKQIKTTGVPVAFVMRGILQQNTFKDAVDFVTSIEHASGQNYILGGPERARCFECSTIEVNEFIPDETDQLTYHTNHYLVDAQPHYCSRLLSMQKHLEKFEYQIDVADLKHIFSSNKWNAGRPICNPFTFASLIMILSQPPELLLAPGMPDRTPYEHFFFTGESYPDFKRMQK